jgi:hypothetical protein
MKRPDIEFVEETIKNFERCSTRQANQMLKWIKHLEEHIEILRKEKRIII